MKTKPPILVVTLVIASMVFGACGPATTPAAPQAPTPVTVKETVQVVVSPTPAPAGPVTITFWHAYSPHEIELLDKTLIPAFEKANPGIKVEAQAVPYEEFRRKLLIAMAGGTAPDVIRSDIIWVPELADIGALAPLDEVMTDFKTYADVVFPGPLATNFYKGHYYGLPLDTNTRVLIWSKDVFASAGITGAPTNVDEFLSDCKKIKALGKYCFADHRTSGWELGPWIWSGGGDITDPAVSKATGYLNGANTLHAYQYLLDLVKKGYAHPGIMGTDVDTWGGFAKGEIAMILDGPWFVPIFAAQYPDVKYGMALVPAGPGGSVSVVGGENIVVLEQSKYQQAASDFVRFMVSPETQLTMAGVGQMPVRSDVADKVIKDTPYFGIFLDQLKSARARTPHPAWTKMDDILVFAGQSILSGTVSPQAGLDDAAAKIDALLK